jgi:hypothetical protein
VNTPDLPKEIADSLTACYTAALDSRDQLTAFYDARHVFASYNEIISSLAAALIKNKIYTKREVAEIMAFTMAEALTRDSTTPVKHTYGTDVIAGGKQ